MKAACNKLQQQAKQDPLPPVIIPATYNYIGVFLTFACTLRCSYCINRFGALSAESRPISGADWQRGLNRIVSRTDLPVTLGGGEPSLHPDFTDIINGIRPELNVDLLTNLEFDIDCFMKDVRPERLRRDSPYASIRVSYHPEFMPLEPLTAKVLRFMDAGYSIGIWGVMHPAQKTEIVRAKEYCQNMGIDFRIKEFLGEHAGQMYGTFRYAGACDRKSARQVLCRTSELLIGPTGHVYRCHSDLYDGRTAIGHILDPNFIVDDSYRHCAMFGYCNPCDVKVKTNRFQEYGHTSVEIVAIDPGSSDLEGLAVAGCRLRHMRDEN